MLCIADRWKAISSIDHMFFLLTRRSSLLTVLERRAFSPVARGVGVALSCHSVCASLSVLPLSPPIFFLSLQQHKHHLHCHHYPSSLEYLISISSLNLYCRPRRRGSLLYRYC